MRATIRIDGSLVAEARKRAAETGRTLSSFIEDAIRESLGRRADVTPAAPVRLRVFNGTGLHAGVDLDGSASLLDQMDPRNRS